MDLFDTDSASVTSIFDLSIPQPAVPGGRSGTGKEAREARCTRSIFELLQTREELRGVYAPADQIAETLRWSA